MRPTSEFRVDDVSVRSELVSAHPKHQPELTTEGNVETAVAAGPARGPSHRSARAVLAVVPTLRSVPASPPAQHLTAAQPDLGGHLVDHRITGGQVSGHQPGIVGRRGQQVTGAQIAGTDPLLPRHPFGRQQRCRPRDEHDFADRGVISTRARGHDDSPLPTPVTGHIGEKAMGGRRRVLEPGAEILADGVFAAVFHDRGARLLDSTHQQGLEVGQDSARSRRGHRP